MGASRRPLGLSWGPLGAESSIFQFVFPLLAPSWGLLGASFSLLQRLWGRLEALLGHLGALSGPPGSVLERFGSLLDGLGASERRKSEKAKNLEKTNENQRFWLLGAVLGGLL